MLLLPISTNRITNVNHIEHPVTPGNFVAAYSTLTNISKALDIDISTVSWNPWKQPLLIFCPLLPDHCWEIMNRYNVLYKGPSVGVTSPVHVYLTPEVSYRILKHCCWKSFFIEPTPTLAMWNQEENHLPGQPSTETQSTVRAIIKYHRPQIMDISL